MEGAPEFHFPPNLSSELSYMENSNTGAEFSPPFCRSRFFPSRSRQGALQRHQTAATEQQQGPAEELPLPSKLLNSLCPRE